MKRGNHNNKIANTESIDFSKLESKGKIIVKDIAETKTKYQIGSGIRFVLDIL